METKNSFLQGKLQLDLDERIVPNGEYRNAENIRVSTSLNSNVGPATNVLGNKQLTFNTIPDSTIIGSVADESGGFLYYFITSPTIDAVYEYDVVNDINTAVLLDTAGRVLKFSTSNRITGTNVIVGNRVIDGQLSWTDNLNQPRKIYIETAKTFGLDGFNDDDISVVKRPPFAEPEVALVRDYNITSNDVSGEFFMFAYRYIYEGQEVSTISFFSESPVTDHSNPTIDPNVINVTVDTGDSRVVGFEIVFNQPNSSSYNLVDKVIKSSAGLGDNVPYTFSFTNSDIYQVLSNSDTLRIFDNVPLLAKDQNFIANRLMYLNYRDGYDIVDGVGDPIVIDYTAESLFQTGFNQVFFTATNPVADQESYTYSTEVVLKGDKLAFATNVLFSGDTYLIFGYYYVKTEGIGDIGSLMTSSEAVDVISFIEDTYSTQAINNTTPGVFTSFDVSVITITSTNLVVEINTPGAFYTTPVGRLDVISTPTTFLSNNSQEFGIVYYDDYNRSSSVQFLDAGKVFYSDLKTRVDNGEGQKGAVEVTINHEPPSFATKYKIVRKDNNYNFNKFFTPSIYKWSEESSYYISLANNEDKNKITLGETIVSVFDKTLTFRAEEIVDDFPTGGVTVGVNKEFGLLKCTLLSGLAVLPIPVPIAPAPSVGTMDFFGGERFNTSEANDTSETYYECSGTFSVTGGFHEGNVQDQTISLPAITDILEGDAYIYGQVLNIDLERFKYNDELTGAKYESVNKIRGNLISSFSVQRDRFASINYSDVYSSDTAYNGLNNFNLSQANFKDLPERDGSIQKSHGRQGNLVVLQENQVSQVLVNRDAYFNAEGDINVTSSSSVLGNQIHYTGEYGISLDPDTFAFWGNNLYYSDTNRGVILRLSLDGQTEISQYGMRGFFKTLLRDSGSSLKIGGYDPVNDEYVLTVGSTTLSFNESTNSWTSFYSFVPEDMVNTRGQFYTFDIGDLYVHSRGDVNRSTFYNVSYPSKLSVVVNSEPSGVKIFQNLQLEGNNPWDVVIKAFKNDSEDFLQSTIANSEFVQEEGMWYAYIRRNELVGNTTSKSTYGLGTVININALDVTIDGGNSSLTVGDDLYIGATQTLVGEITAVNGDILTLTSVAGLSITDFVYGAKDPRIEGAEMRGYVARIDLEQSLDTKLELFSVDTFGIESKP